MALIVQKFGGTSVGTVERIQQVADKVKEVRRGVRKHRDVSFYVEHLPALRARRLRVPALPSGGGGTHSSALPAHSLDSRRRGGGRGVRCSS